MPAFEITPAHSPDLLCEFTIPRAGNRKPIEFSVIRIEYTTPAQNEAWDDWFVNRMKPIPVVDDAGKPVLENGEPKTETPKPITDREFWLKQLECAGVTKSKIDQLATLTDGELADIYNKWQTASKVDQGESEASATS